jgi:hypothetical protein
VVQPAAQRTWRSAAWHRPPTVAGAPNVDARMLPDPDWNALCHVSCSALLGSSPHEEDGDQARELGELARGAGRAAAQEERADEPAVRETMN